jgi:hypothetical protein
MKQKLLMVQPGRFGDIIICMPIAEHFSHDYDVYWPVPRKYESVMRHIPYVTPIYYDKTELNILPVIYAQAHNFQKVVDLAFGFPGSKVAEKIGEMSSKSFVSIKYAMVGLPLERRYDLKWRRDVQHEEALFRAVVQHNVYCFVHDQASAGVFNVGRSSLPIVKVRNVDGFSIFDWHKVIMNAREIRCVDSAFANFIEVLKECKAQKFMKLKEDKTVSQTYRNGWAIS